MVSCVACLSDGGDGAAMLVPFQRLAKGLRCYPSVNNESAGLQTPRPPRFSTWVYTIVVVMSRCPNSSCMVLMSYPSSSK